MSQENVETVRRAIEVFVSASYDPRAISVDEFFEVYDRDIEYDVSRTNRKLMCTADGTASTSSWSNGF